MNFTLIKRLQFLPVVFFCFFAACSGKPSDSELQQSLNKQLNGNENYKGTSASVSNSIVTLNGNCEGENCVIEIEKVVKENKYVDSVINNIQEKSSITPVPLNTSLQKIVSKYPGVQGEISDSIIVLKGSITRENLPLLMKEISALHPKKVDDQMEVKVN